ncbi:hypothetical protein CRENBAI_013268, partial [Crenichthys baileyi]
ATTTPLLFRLNTVKNSTSHVNRVSSSAAAVSRAKNNGKVGYQTERPGSADSGRCIQSVWASVY